MKFYSQSGQDKIIFENFFKNKDNGYYVDIGAHDGITFSNTYFFEQLGWKGICIEPNPVVFTKLSMNRTCEISNHAICERNGTVKFLQVGHPQGKNEYTEMLSGRASKYDMRHMNRVITESEREGVARKLIDVPASTFDNIVKEKNIDFLSIDVEGAELDIVNNINFKDYNISVITLENNFKDQTINEILLTNGYKIFQTIGADYIFYK